MQDAPGLDLHPANAGAQGGYATVGGNDLMATVMTDVLDELPDNTTVNSEQQCTSPSQERSRPTHPASDISVLRGVVSAVLTDESPACQSRNSVSSSSHTSTSMSQYDLTRRDSRKGESGRRRASDMQRSSIPSKHAPKIQLPHHHPEAPGTPWPESPPQEVVNDFEEAQRIPHGDTSRPPLPAYAEGVAVLSNAASARPASMSTATAPLLPEQSPATLVTCDVIEGPRADSPVSEALLKASKGSSEDSHLPSASELSPEALREYIASMEIIKPKSRPRRKHLDYKLQQQKLKQQLEEILTRRAELIKLEESNSVPAEAAHETRDINKFNDVQDTSSEHGEAYDETSNSTHHTLYDRSTASGDSQRHPLSTSGTSTLAISIEEEIYRLNDHIEALMVSINELDKIKDPQIELSFTGPKTKNLQRARPDDDLWTDLTGRAPGIRRLSGFGTAYDTERTILTPTVSECSEVPTLSPMSSRSNLSIASSRSAHSLRSNRSQVGHRSVHKVSIMQTLTEAEDSDQASFQNASYAPCTDEGSQAVTAGSVANDHGRWHRDLGTWARRSSPSPVEGSRDRQLSVEEAPASPTSFSEARRREESRRLSKERHRRASLTMGTASSTVSRLGHSDATSPPPQTTSDSGSSDSQSHKPSLHAPHVSQKNPSRKPPSTKRTRQAHLVAGLQGAEWTGHRRLTAELQVATDMQRKSSPEGSFKKLEESLSKDHAWTECLSQEREQMLYSANPSREHSSLDAAATLRLAAETLVASVASAAHAFHVAFESWEASELAKQARSTKGITVSPPDRLALQPHSHIYDLPTSQDQPAFTNGFHNSIRQENLESVDLRAIEHLQQQQTLCHKVPLAKRSKRPRLTEAELEEKRVKEAARQIKEQHKAARWHQRRLAIDAKKIFQAKKDELHTRLANTRNDDARSEVQWELGELYAAYAWGEPSEDVQGRDKPALGAGALTHALRRMYEALYSPSRREKGSLPAVAFDSTKWARYAHLHMIMWSQTGGKTHLEWALRAYGEAIKQSGDRTEQSGDICTTAAQSLQAQAGNSAELLQRAVTFWQRSTRCECSDNVRMAWRYINLAHCYDVLTSLSIARGDEDSDPATLRNLCIDAIEKAHSLDPANGANAERLRYYKSLQDDEQVSLEDSGEPTDYGENSTHSPSSTHESPRGLEMAMSEHNQHGNIEMIEDTSNA